LCSDLWILISEIS